MTWTYSHGLIAKIKSPMARLFMGFSAGDEKQQLGMRNAAGHEPARQAGSKQYSISAALGFCQGFGSFGTAALEIEKVP
jgi:hypothetical protein